MALLPLSHRMCILVLVVAFACCAVTVKESKTVAGLSAAPDNVTLIGSDAKAAKFDAVPALGAVLMAPLGSAPLNTDRNDLDAELNSFSAALKQQLPPHHRLRAQRWWRYRRITTRHRTRSLVPIYDGRRCLKSIFRRDRYYSAPPVELTLDMPCFFSPLPIAWRSLPPRLLIGGSGCFFWSTRITGRSEQRKSRGGEDVPRAQRGRDYDVPISRVDGPGDRPKLGKSLVPDLCSQK
jgi:hypothetical protein